MPSGHFGFMTRSRATTPHSIPRVPHATTGTIRPTTPPGLRLSPPAMNLLHVIASIRAAGGGPAEAVRSLSAVHQRNGHSVEVASLDDPAEEEVRSFPLPLHALGPGPNTYSFAPAFVPWLRQN